MEKRWDSAKHPRNHDGSFASKTGENAGTTGGAVAGAVGGFLAGKKYGPAVGEKIGRAAGATSSEFGKMKWGRVGRAAGGRFGHVAGAAVVGAAGALGAGAAGKSLDAWRRNRAAGKEFASRVADGRMTPDEAKERLARFKSTNGTMSPDKKSLKRAGKDGLKTANRWRKKLDTARDTLDQLGAFKADGGDEMQKRELSEAEIQQRRDAAKARWDKTVNANTAVGAVGGAVLGALSGDIGGRGLLNAFGRVRSKNEKGPGRDTLAANLRASRDTRRKIVEEGRKTRQSFINSRAQNNDSEVKAKAAERKIFEEARNRGDTDMKDVSERAKAFGDKVRARTRKVNDGPIREEAAGRARSAMRNAVRAGVGITRRGGPGINVGGKYMRAASIAGGTVGAIAGGTSMGIASQNQLEEISSKTRKIGLAASAAGGALGFAGIGGSLGGRRGAAIGAAGGAAIGAAVDGITHWAGSYQRPELRRLMGAPANKADTLDGLRKGLVDAILQKRSDEKYGEIQRMRPGSALTGAVAHGIGGASIVPGLGLIGGGVAGGMHGSRAAKLRRKLGGSPKNTPKDLKGRLARNVGGATNTSLVGLAGALAGGAVGARIGGPAGLKIGAGVGALATAPYTYARGHRRVRDSQIWQRDFDKK